jgi:hypothetical protein
MVRDSFGSRGLFAGFGRSIRIFEFGFFLLDCRPNASPLQVCAVAETKETGFLVVAVGLNEVLSKKPGF